MLRGMYSGPESPPAPVPAEPLVVFAGRHIPEKRAPAVVRRAWRAGARPCAGWSSATGPEYERGAGRDRSGRRRRPRRGAGLRRRPSRSSASWPARCAWCCPRGARATGWSSSRRRRWARRRVLVRDPDNAATELVEEGVNGFVVDERVAGGLAGGDRAGARRRGRRCAPRPPSGSRATRAGCRSTARSTRSPRATARASARA